MAVLAQDSASNGTWSRISRPLEAIDTHTHIQIQSPGLCAVGNLFSFYDVFDDRHQQLNRQNEPDAIWVSTVPYRPVNTKASSTFCSSRRQWQIEWNALFIIVLFLFDFIWLSNFYQTARIKQRVASRDPSLLSQPNRRHMVMSLWPFDLVWVRSAYLFIFFLDNAHAINSNSSLIAVAVETL